MTNATRRTDDPLPGCIDDEQARARNMALSLMLQALAILDRTGPPQAAAVLAAAIDAAGGSAPALPD